MQAFWALLGGKKLDNYKPMSHTTFSEEQVAYELYKRPTNKASIKEDRDGKINLESELTDEFRTKVKEILEQRKTDTDNADAAASKSERSSRSSDLQAKINLLN